MGDVEDIFGRTAFGWDDLETSRPMGFANAAFDRFRRNCESLVAENFRRRNCESDVAQLMSAYQRGFHQNLLP